MGKNKRLLKEKTAKIIQETVAIVGGARDQTLVHLKKVPNYRVIVVRSKAETPIEEGIEIFGKPGRNCWADFVKHQNICLLHAYRGMEAIRVTKLSLSLGLPMVALFTGVDLTAKPRDPVYRRLLHDTVFKQSRLLVTVCEFLKRRLIDLGCPHEKITVWRRGIDLELFSFQPPHPPRRNKEIRIISVGRFVDKKGMDDLIQAFARFHREYPQGRLTIIGEGPMQEKIQALIHELKLQHCVELAGHVPFRQISVYLRRSHIFGIASRTAVNGDQEGVPRALLEAMATGLPVLATRHAGIPEAVIHGNNGYLVEERDINGLKNGLIHLALDSANWRRMGKESRHWIEQNGELTCQMRKLGALYDLALGVEG